MFMKSFTKWQHLLHIIFSYRTKQQFHSLPVPDAILVMSPFFAIFPEALGICGIVESTWDLEILPTYQVILKFLRAFKQLKYGHGSVLLWQRYVMYFRFCG